MNNEEKILGILTKMQAQQEQMQTQLGQVQAQQEQMQTQLGQVQAQQEQMQTQLGEMKEQQDRMDKRQDLMEMRLIKAQDEIHLVKAYLELDVEQRLAAINDGIDLVKGRLISETRVKAAEDDIVVLKVAVKALARDVAELKQAK